VTRVSSAATTSSMGCRSSDSRHPPLVTWIGSDALILSYLGNHFSVRNVPLRTKSAVRLDT
jgi:hypothetical protein